MRVHADQKTAPAAVDVDQRQVEDGLFEIDRNLLFRSEWAGAADQIAGVAIGGGGLAAGIAAVVASLTLVACSASGTAATTTATT